MFTLLEPNGDSYAEHPPSSGPLGATRGIVPARRWALGLAQYILNVRAAGLSGPDAAHAASHALRAQTFALVKSETYDRHEQRKN